MCTAIVWEDRFMETVGDLFDAVGRGRVVWLEGSGWGDMERVLVAGGHDPQTVSIDCCGVDVEATAAGLGLFCAYDAFTIEWTAEPQTMTRVERAERALFALGSLMRVGAMGFCRSTDGVRTKAGVVLNNLHQARTGASIRRMLTDVRRHTDSWRERALHQGLFQHRRNHGPALGVRGFRLRDSYRPAEIEHLSPWRRAQRIPGWRWKQGGRPVRQVLGIGADRRSRATWRLIDANGRMAGRS